MELENELSETTKRHSGIGCLKAIGWGLVVLTLLILLGMFWNHTRMESKLQRTMAEIDRTEPGWRIEDIEAARKEVPEDENSARVVMAASEQMPKRWPSADLPEEHFRLLPPNEMLSGEDFVRLSKELANVRTALTIAERLADMPRGRHRIHYERNPIATLLGDQQESRRIVSLLAYEAMRLSQKGDSKQALMLCRAALNAARSLGDEPIYISQLIRMAGVVHSCLAIERTLAQGEPPTEELSTIQKLLEEEDAFPGLLTAARGERALLHKVFEALDRGEASLDELEGLAAGSGRPQPNRMKNALLSLWRMDSAEESALFLSLMTRYINEAQRPMPEQASREKEFEQEVRSLPNNAMITRLLLPALGKMGEAFRREHASIRCMIVALSVERYRREKKTWPEAIDQLCPQFLAAVPLDPYDGKPLRYRRVADGVVIYSVGQDVTDNDGNLDPEHPLTPGTDLGFRLWDVKKRRRPPQPKAPEQNPR